MAKVSGTAFGKAFPSSFDKVLVDVPCSKERHLLHDDFKYGGWSLKRSKEFASLQTKLLSSALRTVNVGGTVVYSTCSLSPFENQGVVEKTLKQVYKKFDIVAGTIDTSYVLESFGENMFSSWTEATVGNLVVPSQEQNWGPMYFCRLIRHK